MDHHTLAERRVAMRVCGNGGLAVAMPDHAESMVMSVADMRRGRRYGDPVVMTGAMNGGGGACPMMAMMRGRRRRGRRRGVVMAVMDQRKALARRQHEQRQTSQGGGPQYNSHHVFPHQARPEGRAARSQSCFNTMGTRPGKSSLTRPGPNASAQAAWIQAPAQAASKLSIP